MPLAQWDCREIARQLVDDEIVTAVSAETVRQVLRKNGLRPWRWHAWLSCRVPRDTAYFQSVTNIVHHYTRPLADDEIVLCVDEKTSLQPRWRLRPTRPARPRRPLQIEHEYERCGSLNLFAAFDTRTGAVFGMTAERKRAIEFIAFLERIEARTPADVRTIHIVLDNLRVHKGKAVAAWLLNHPRIVMHFPPVHCSWLNQVEQWFGIIQRKLLRLSNYRSREDLAAAIQSYIERWNRSAHPFNWQTGSIRRVMAAARYESAAA